MRVESKVGPIRDERQARKMAHIEDEYRNFTKKYNLYLANPEDFSGGNPSLVKEFKILAKRGVTPDYIIKLGELDAELYADLEDFKSKLESISDKAELEKLLGRLGNEMHENNALCDRLSEEDPFNIHIIGAVANIKSQPPEYINAQKKTVFAGLKIGWTEHRLHKLGK